MDIETVLKKHAMGFYETVFGVHYKTESAMVGYVAHATDSEDAPSINGKAVGACHASVNTIINRNTAVAVITMADRDLAENKGAIQYYDWLINKSFFSDVFLCKDPVLSLKYGFVKKIDVSAAKWLGAAQLSRLSTSEFKKDMKAVYDILASGFDIHPMFLTLLTTELNFVSDGRIVTTTRRARIDSLCNVLCSSHYAHLPFYYLDSIAKLKQACKDDPNKPQYYVARGSFREGRWPSGSNRILCDNAGYSDNRVDAKIQQAVLGLLQGTSSLLFNSAVVAEVDYTFLWEEAVLELRKKVQSPVSSVGTAVNLSSIELLSKTLKLGE